MRPRAYIPPPLDFKCAFAASLPAHGSISGAPSHKKTVASAPSSPFTAAGLLRICTEFLVRPRRAAPQGTLDLTISLYQHYRFRTTENALFHQGKRAQNSVLIVGKFSRVDLSPVFDRLGQLGIGDNAEEYFFCLIGAYIAAKQIEKILVIRPQKLDFALLVGYPDDLIAVKLDMRCFVRRRDIVSSIAGHKLKAER